MVAETSMRFHRSSRVSTLPCEDSNNEDVATVSTGRSTVKASNVTPERKEQIATMSASVEKAVREVVGFYKFLQKSHPRFIDLFQDDIRQLRGESEEQQNDRMNEIASRAKYLAERKAVAAESNIMARPRAWQLIQQCRYRNEKRGLYKDWEEEANKFVEALKSIDFSDETGRAFLEQLARKMEEFSAPVQDLGVADGEGTSSLGSGAKSEILRFFAYAHGQGMTPGPNVDVTYLTSDLQIFTINDLKDAVRAEDFDPEHRLIKEDHKEELPNIIADYEQSHPPIGVDGDAADLGEEDAPGNA